MLSTCAYWVPALLYAALIFWLSHQPDLPGPEGIEIPDWLAHGIEYFFFTLTLAFAVTRGFRPHLRNGSRVLTATLIAIVYGITDEYHQSFIPGRDPAVSDWIADTAGAIVMAALLSLVFGRMAGQPDRV